MNGQQTLMKQFFIAGTDTDVGKTLVSTAILYAAKQRGLSTVALKPVAAGCEKTSEGLRNGDALSLLNETTLPLSYEQINPVALEPPIAPHIAAADAGVELSVKRLQQACEPVITLRSDLLLVEGAGGWRVPLNGHETLADLAVALSFPVVLVVGLRLGCISHALLTAEAIRHDGLVLAGWVANQIDPDMPKADENMATLAHRLDVPCLGHIPFLNNQTASHAAKYLDIGKLLD